MEVLGWIVFLIFAIYALNLLLSFYRYKTNSYYKYRVEQLIHDEALEKNDAHLRDIADNSENTVLKNMAKTLLGEDSQINDPYVRDFFNASKLLGTELNQNEFLNNPKFISRIKKIRDSFSPYEFAALNSAGILTKNQIATPCPYPNELHLSLVIIGEWASAGKISSLVYESVLSSTNEELKAVGQAL
jgi:hypothetical protein